jgi:glucose-6-phosphate isomerase
MGQLLQDGKRNLFETVINIDLDKSFIKVPEIENSKDGLDYIAGKSIAELNKIAEKATCMAHMEGGVPIIEINVKELNAYSVGQLIYFFEKACAISGYILGVNPFDQPGVEEYKRRMRELLNRD